MQKIDLDENIIRACQIGIQPGEYWNVLNDIAKKSVNNALDMNESRTTLQKINIEKFYSAINNIRYVGCYRITDSKIEY